MNLAEKNECKYLLYAINSVDIYYETCICVNTIE